MTTAFEVHGTGTTTGDISGGGAEGDTREFPCEQCGAKLTFSIGQQTLACPYCGHTKALEIPDDRPVVEQDFHAVLGRLGQQRLAQTQVADKEATCTTCGGSVVFTANLTSLTCPYCGAPVQREDVHDAPARIPPDGVLPFLVEKKQADGHLKGWVKSRWFAPNEFKSRGVRGKFDGVYVPYWTYDSMTYTRYRGERGEHYYVTERDSQGNEKRVRHTRWYPASGSFSRFFDDVLVAATDRMPAKLLEELEPWPFDKLMPFNQDVMAGYLAQTYSVPLEKGWTRAQGKIDSAIHVECRRRIGGDEQRVHHVSTQYNAITFKHLLLPVWNLSYKYGEKTYRVCINACTGEVIGERPWSWIKITLAVLVAVTVAALLWYFFGQQR